MTEGSNRDDAALRRAELAAERAHQDETVRSMRGNGELFQNIMARRISRRSVLKGSAAAAAMVLAAPALGKVGDVQAQPTNDSLPGIHFQPLGVQPATNQFVHTAEGYKSGILLAWGDPIMQGAPEFDVENQSADAQTRQFGYNCDYIGYHPLPWEQPDSVAGLLWVNHEYTNEELMFAGYDPENPTEQQVRVAWEAHGGSVVEIRRTNAGTLYAETRSRYNRRITATTEMGISGPAAAHDWLMTGWDPTGTRVLGTLNNCAGGWTPWGTILTCEENFHQYFGNLEGLTADDPRFAVHERYGMPEGASERKWERYDARFSIGDEPNEGFRHGWVVEIDPYTPGSMPMKRTALGRFRHEGATFGHSPSGRVANYSGDDQRFDYVYKYVSNEAWDNTTRGMAQELLDDGVLYVAQFNDDGAGVWLPLVHGEGPLTDENGFTSQGDVLIKTRLAADALAATKMDRPEDIQQNPVNHKIYMAMTNNTARTADEVDEANPRAENEFGHIIEVTEDGDDAASTTFTWDILLLCGEPEDPSTYFAGFPKESVSAISCPDNVNFDLAGNLWISTDGQPGTIDQVDALYCVPVEGDQRGNVQRFMSVVAGAECASFEFTHNNRAVVVAVQHPGEGGTVEEPVTLWPFTSSVPRPSVVVVVKDDGGVIGQ
jgi:hypothetical protein